MRVPARPDAPTAVADAAADVAARVVAVAPDSATRVCRREISMT
jgi:hypothetical protein